MRSQETSVGSRSVGTEPMIECGRLRHGILHFQFRLEHLPLLLTRSPSVTAVIFYMRLRSEKHPGNPPLRRQTTQNLYNESFPPYALSKSLPLSSCNESAMATYANFDPPSTLKPAQVAVQMLEHGIVKHRTRPDIVFFKAVSYFPSLCHIACSY